MEQPKTFQRKSGRAALLLPLPRDAGHLDARTLWLTGPWRNVIRTVQLKEMIIRRNEQNGDRDQSRLDWRCPEESENLADSEVCVCTLRRPNTIWTPDIQCVSSKQRLATAGHQRNHCSWNCQITTRFTLTCDKSSINSFGWFMIFFKKGMIKYDFLWVRGKLTRVVP